MNIQRFIGVSNWMNNNSNERPIKGHLRINGKCIKLGEDKEQIDNKTAAATNKENQLDPEVERKRIQEEMFKQLQENLWGEDSEERYQKILQKANNGENLSEKEMAYLRMKDPKLYYEIKSEMMFAKRFEQQLKNCKSKEEAQEVYIQTVDVAARMSGVKGNNGVTPNKIKFNRMMKRINKIWDKYNKGKLDKKDCNKKNSLDTVESHSKIGSIKCEEQIRLFEYFTEKVLQEEVYDKKR